MQAARTLCAIADVLTYPGENYSELARACAACASASCAGELRAFAEAVAPLSTEAAQELFTRTFDLNPLCSLELGWHLFGENYERGLLLVRMRQEMRACGLPESSELPDHLTHALRLIDRMEHERAADFTSAIVLPALMKMLPTFGEKQNPYEHVLRALALALREAFPEIPLPETKVELPVISQEVTV
jgi:nitrate reductase delta subunit